MGQKIWVVSIPSFNCEYLCAFIYHRDLQLVLNGHNIHEPSNLLFTNGKTALLLPSSHLTANTSVDKPPVIPPKYANATISPQAKNSVSGIGLVKIMHLCEQVDCNKPLFGK